MFFKAALFALALSCAPSAFALSDADLKTCEALIADLRSHTELTFIRNGSEHTAAEAADHLQMKLDYAADDLNSVQDFITEIASHSSLSGRKYEVVFPDGRRLSSEEFLKGRLKDLGFEQ